MEKSWYAVYTKLNCELKVAAHLSKKKIENFCPVNIVPNNTGFKKRLNTVPLFKSIVFVYVSRSEIQIVTKINEVFNLLYWLGAPAVISNEEIINLERFTNDYSDIKVDKIPVNKLSAMQVTKVPYTGNFDKNSSFNQAIVTMILPSLGYSIKASVELPINNVFDLASGTRRRSVL